VRGGACAIPPWGLLRPSAAIMQTLPEAEQRGKGRNTNLMASKWNGERREDVTVATKTYTHTHQPATLLLILSGAICSATLQSSYLNLL